MSGKQLGFVPKNSWFDSYYCSYRPCADSRVAMGDCAVDVDPFLHSCIQIYSAVETYNPEVVRYTSELPTMISAGNLAIAITESMESLLIDNDSQSPLSTSLRRFIRLVGDFLFALFSHSPIYLFNLVMGSLLFVYSESLASSTLFQYFLAGSLGLVLALAWFLFSIYR